MKTLKIIRLSERLKKVASFVPQQAVLADIGSDHAYLPTYLVQTGVISKAIAGEVVQGPYDSAVRNIKKEGVAHHITVRLANGLFAIEQEDGVNTVTIAGMGGALIATILEEGKERLSTVSRLIVQPNIHAAAVREWAINNNWLIVDEAIIREDGKFYEIVVLERGQATYSEVEMLVGPYLMREKNAVFLEKWTHEVFHWKEVFASLAAAEKNPAIEEKMKKITQQIQFVEEVLSS